MFQITHFDKRLCQLMRHHLDLIDDNICEIYSIWNLCPRTRWQAVKNFYCGKFPCRAQYFPFIYWLILTISVFGCFYSCYEMYSMFVRGGKQLVMWRQRTFYVLPPSVLRKFRLVGAFINFLSCFSLCYAFAKISPTHMIPWLTIKMYVLGAEFIIWVIQVFLGVCKLEWQTVAAFAFAMLSYFSVSCVQSVFIKAIAMNDVENLSLWKSFQSSKFSFSPL